MNEFLNLFSEQERSITIEKLAQKFFDEGIWIADGMELSHTSTECLQYFIINEEKHETYKNDFLIFGQATHSGSLYAFFKQKNSKNCDEWPIVVLGDEGGILVLAKNIFDLMRFWTLNSVQPYIHEDKFDNLNFSLFFETDFEENNDEYKNWIQSEFEIIPLTNIEEAQKEIIEPAIKTFQHEIDLIFEN